MFAIETINNIIMNKKKVVTKTPKKVAKLPTKKVVKRIVKKPKRNALVAFFATLIFGALAFVAWKKRYNRLSVVFGLFSLLNAGFFVFNIDALAPLIKGIPTFTLLFSCLGSVVFSAINLVSPKSAKRITKLLNL